MSAPHAWILLPIPIDREFAAAPDRTVSYLGTLHPIDDAPLLANGCDFYRDPDGQILCRWRYGSMTIATQSYKDLKAYQKEHRDAGPFQDLALALLTTSPRSRMPPLRLVTADDVHPDLDPDERPVAIHLRVDDLITQTGPGVYRLRHKGVVERTTITPRHYPRLCTALRLLEEAGLLSPTATLPTKGSVPMPTPLPIPDQWTLLGKTLDAKAARILVTGPPGIGKSYAGAAWAAKQADWEFLSVTLTDQTPASELRGHFILKGHDFVWHDGIISRAWRMTQAGQSVLVEINEIIEAGPDVEVFLHNALDDPEFARLDLPTGETLRPFPGRLIVLATMNGAPGDLRPALLDRFPVRLAVNEPHPDAIKALPPRVRKLAASLCAASRGSQRLSIRPFVAFVALSQSLSELDAAAAIFGPDQAHDIVAGLGVAKL